MSWGFTSPDQMPIVQVMEQTKRDTPVLITLIGGLAMFAAAFLFIACGGGGTTSQGGTTVETTPASTSSSTTVTTARAKPAGMTFAQCQASAEYPGGRYAFEYDNGVCTVQTDDVQETTTTTAAVTAVSYASCAEARAAGVAPISKGQPGYSTRLDADKDGIACDK